MEELEYSGKLKVFIDFLSAKTSFKMHSTSPVQVLCIKDDRGSTLNFETQPFELIQILLEKETSGQSFVEIEFKVKVGKTCEGCYFSQSYHPIMKEIRTMVITHFEPTYARQALPCFDEPMFKSTFDLCVKADGWEVVSNMRGKLDETSGKIKFDRSPSMSIYLLHWTICNHQKISVTSGETEVSLYSDYPEYSRYSLEIAKDCLEFYNQEFQIPYPLPKLDLIAVYSKF
jgi:aminopeptidase N